MPRALSALFLAPVLGGLLYGYFATIAIPIMLAIAALVALPLFFLLRRLQWLQWWVAAGAGAMCGLALAPVYWAVSPPYHVEYIGVRNVLLFLGTGLMVGLLFWWIGVFRNGAFPSVSAKPPISMLLVLPIAAVVVWIHDRLEPHFITGRATALLQEPRAQPEQSGSVEMRLPGGMLVQARLPAGYGDGSIVGRCFLMSERWSITQSEKLYFIHALKPGPNSNDC